MTPLPTALASSTPPNASARPCAAEPCKRTPALQRACTLSHPHARKLESTLRAHELKLRSTLPVRLRSRLGLLRLAALLVLMADFAQAAPAPTPNVLRIVADDRGYGDHGSYGGKARTPHLDRLAAEGVRFTDFHSNGSVCSPTRAALLTGRYPHRLGIETALPTDWHDNGLGAPRNRNQVTIAARLRTAGYATAIFGKWHLGKHMDSNPVRHGFDEFRGLTCGCGDYFAKLDRTGVEDWWHNETRVEESGYVTEVLTDHAVRFISEQRDRPFFLYLPHLAIHFPWQTPEDAGRGTRQPGVAFNSNEPGLNSKLGPHEPEEVAQTVVRMIESLDTGVGRVLATLREHGLDERTLVVFTSDNGGYRRYAKAWTQGISNNGPLRGQKGDVHEGGHRVPSIARWPGRIPAGRVTDATAMSMDLAPTFLEFAGLTAPAAGSPKAFDGVSLVPLLTKGAALPERALFWRHTGPGGPRAVRLGPWKLVQPPGRQPAELYRLDADLGETRDLSTAEPKRVAHLQQLLQGWESSLNAAR